MYRVLIATVLIFALSGVAGARTILYELFVSLSDNIEAYTSDHVGGQLGASVASGDFNGDGIDDLLIGAPFATAGDKKWAGAVKVILSGDNNEVLTFWGMSAGDQLGTSMTTGDFNNDGYDDMAIGAYNAFYKGSRAGRVYVINGQPNLANRWGSQSVDFNYYTPDLALVGAEEGGGFGLNLEAADLDGNGADDLLVGAPMTTSTVAEKSGEVNVYLGGYGGLSSYVDMVFPGQTEGERFGTSIAVGDLGGSQAMDIVIGAYKADNGSFQEAGRAYVYMDIDTYKVQLNKPTSYIEGVEPKGWLGFDVEIGEIERGDDEELLVSSFPYLGDRRGAKVQGFYGGGRLAEEGAVLFASDESTGWVMAEEYGETVLGADIELADLNNDGQMEIIVGAPGIGNPKSDYAGSVFVFYGGVDSMLTSSVYGENADDWFGYAISSGDYNGDGHADLAVGSRYADAERSVNNGKLFVVYGDGEVLGTERSYRDGDVVNRAELVKQVVDRLKLKEVRAENLDKCLEHREFCLFNFMAMSDFNGLSLDPLLLYPDINADHQYYEEINVATMLGIVNGYLSVDQSPFYPDKSVSRVQALKVVLGAAGLVDQKYKFELVQSLGSAENVANQESLFLDVNPKITHMWWYPRYVNFAAEKGIVEASDLFRPDDDITMGELDDFIEKTLIYIKERDAQTNSSGDTGDEASSVSSEENGT